MCYFMFLPCILFERLLQGAPPLQAERIDLLAPLRHCMMKALPSPVDRHTTKKEPAFALRMEIAAGDPKSVAQSQDCPSSTLEDPNVVLSLSVPFSALQKANKCREKGGRGGERGSAITAEERTRLSCTKWACSHREADLAIPRNLSVLPRAC